MNSGASVNALAGEFGALKLVRSHTSIPTPCHINLICTPESSYLLTSRLQGKKAGICLDGCSDDDTATMVEDLRHYVTQLRAIKKRVNSEYAITNAIGEACLDYRISDREVGPFANEQAFNEFLRLGVEPELVHGGGHEIVFTHGDLNMRNILVKDGRISGIVDWENAGWYPEYWEYIKCRWGVRRNQRWLGIVSKVFESFENFKNYEEEMDIERQLWDLAPPL